jgi:hypothetical protein
MISRSLFAVAVLSFLFLGSQSAQAQIVEHSFVEGHVFDAKTMRPLRGANVALVTFYDACPVSYGGDTSDSGGLYRLGGSPDGDTQYSLNELIVQCTLRKSRKRVTYTTSFYIPLVGGRIYQRDLYITIPDGDTGCIEAPFSPPKHPRNATSTLCH